MVDEQTMPKIDLIKQLAVEPNSASSPDVSDTKGENSLNNSKRSMPGQNQP